MRTRGRCRNCGSEFGSETEAAAGESPEHEICASCTTRSADAGSRSHLGLSVFSPPTTADFSAPDPGNETPVELSSSIIVDRWRTQIPDAPPTRAADLASTRSRSEGSASPYGLALGVDRGDDRGGRDEDRLQLLEELGRGGMGSVHRGRDPKLGRDLAVKVLLGRHRHHAELLERFVEEAQIGGQLQHPGIVPIYELGEMPGHGPYFTMKLIRGQTLHGMLKSRTRLDEDRSKFVGVFEQICQTMAYAHARKVIHRDLKPSNVMVGGFGEVQVMDWGLAKVLRPESIVSRSRSAGDEEDRPEASLAAVDEDAVQTSRQDSADSASRWGAALGTPSYMAPEQVLGENDRVNERADVFGLGAILCEILTNHPPYDQPSQSDALQAAARADLTAAARRLDDCGADAELIALARRCLEPDPGDRPAHAGEVA